MNCIFCGAELNDTDQLCPSCGSMAIADLTVVSNSNNNAVEASQQGPAAEPTPVKANPNVMDGFSIKWFNLFKKIFIWIFLGGALLFYIYSAISEIHTYFSDDVFGYYFNSEIGPYNQMNLLGNIFMTIILLVARPQLVAFQKIGYTLVQTFWITRAIWPILSLFILYNGNPFLEILAYAVFLNFLTIMISLLNFIYFFKRRTLFSK